MDFMQVKSVFTNAVIYFIIKKPTSLLRDSLIASTILSLNFLSIQLHKVK